MFAFIIYIIIGHPNTVRYGKYISANHSCNCSGCGVVVVKVLYYQFEGCEFDFQFYQTPGPWAKPLTPNFSGV